MSDVNPYQTTPTFSHVAEAKNSLAQDKLELISGDASATHAIIFVGGIHSDNYHFFDKWAPSLDTPGTTVMGWVHDHQSATMTDSAKSLADAVGNLKDFGITHVTIIAHSMGGLVAKGAIDELSRNGEAAGFDQVDLHAFGTPWGGFAMAELTKLPGAGLVSEAIGYPMGPEMRPSSDYIESLARPMPGSGQLHLYVGTADKTALPGSNLTEEPYKAIEAIAASVVEIYGYGHDSYNEASANILTSYTGEIAPGFERVDHANTNDFGKDSPAVEKEREQEAAEIEMSYDA